jgi:hypothetical protein
MHEAEESRLRIAHLFNHVQGTLPSIGFDELSKQMDRHCISAGFSPQRLLEVFASSLEQERESLIGQTAEALAAARRSRRAWRSRLRTLQCEAEQSLEPLYATQCELRGSLHRLGSFGFDAAWRHKRARARAEARCHRCRSFFESELESIQSLSNSLKGFSNLLGQTRRSVLALESAHRASMVAIRRAVKGTAVRPQAHTDPRVAAAKGELEREQAISKSLRQAFEEVRSFVSSTEKVEIPPIEVSDVAFHRAFQKALKMRLKRGVSYAGTGTQVIAEIDRRLRMKDEEALPRLRKQKERLKKLEQALQRAEAKLAGLLAFDNVVDPALLHALEDSRKTMSGTQERTDFLMQQLQNSLGSSGGP